MSENQSSCHGNFSALTAVHDASLLNLPHGAELIAFYQLPAHDTQTHMQSLPNVYNTFLINGHSALIKKYGSCTFNVEHDVKVFKTNSKTLTSC